MCIAVITKCFLCPKIIARLCFFLFIVPFSFKINYIYWNQTNLQILQAYSNYWNWICGISCMFRKLEINFGFQCQWRSLCVWAYIGPFSNIWNILKNFHNYFKSDYMEIFLIVRVPYVKLMERNHWNFRTAVKNIVMLTVNFGMQVAFW